MQGSEFPKRALHAASMRVRVPPGAQRSRASTTVGPPFSKPLTRVRVPSGRRIFSPRLGGFRASVYEAGCPGSIPGGEATSPFRRIADPSVRSSAPRFDSERGCWRTRWWFISGAVRGASASGDRTCSTGRPGEPRAPHSRRRSPTGRGSTFRPCTVSVRIGPSVPRHRGGTGIHGRLRTCAPFGA